MNIRALDHIQGFPYLLPHKQRQTYKVVSKKEIFFGIS